MRGPNATDTGGQNQNDKYPSNRKYQFATGPKSGRQAASFKIQSVFHRTDVYTTGTAGAFGADDSGLYINR